MKGATQYRKNKVIPTIKYVTCPACNKDRLTKYLDDTTGVVEPTDVTSVDVRGEERYLDACGFCVGRYKKSDDKFVMENMRKLMEASKSIKTDENDEASDHKDFSLN